jgi:iron complex transport system ATP-binding protein
MMGRYPFFTTSPSNHDKEICNQALHLMESHELSQRDYNTLSGGEAQKIQMSRVLSQIWEARAGEEKILFLDEPVSHLDLKYQHQLLQTAKEFCKRQATVIAILHDINLALLYADRIIFLKQGNLVHETSIASDVSPQIIKVVFDVDAKVMDIGKGGGW